METHLVLLLISTSFSFGEWIQIPSFSSKQNGFKKRASVSTINVTRPVEADCPDFHNLTVISYGSKKTHSSEAVQSSEEWDISLEDVQELIRESKRIPKITAERVEFLTEIEEKMISETEKRITNLFPVESREARTFPAHYPSMESALMTISMLLFGVYLTKLILKLLQSHYYKYNPNMLGMLGGIRAPIMIAQGRRRRKRSTSPDVKKLHLMHLIDKFDSRFN